MSGRVFHAPILHVLKGFSLYGAVERHTAKAAETYPRIRSWPAVEAMLEDPAIELVIVNTPNVTHYDYAMQALSAGKHVVVEKPIAATHAQAQDMAELAKRQDKSLITFQNRRWDSDFLAVKAVVDGKLLGTLIEAEFHFDRYKKALSAKLHKEATAPGTGNLYDLGPHLIDQAICLFGAPEKVFAMVQTHRPGSQVDDYFDISLMYPGHQVRLKSSLLVREPVPAFVLQGTEGSFLKSRSDSQEAMLQQGRLPDTPDWGQEPPSAYGLLHTEEHGSEVRRPFPSPAGSYPSFYEGVYRHLREGAPAPVPLADSLLNMRIIEAALESSRRQSVVALR